MEGTFETWRWEKLITEFRTRLQAAKTLDIAQLWFQKSIIVNQQGIQKAVSVRKKRIMYTWPEGIAEPSNPIRETEEALSGLTLLRQAGSAGSVTAVVSPEFPTVPTVSDPLPVSLPQPSSITTEASALQPKANYDLFSTTDLNMLCESRRIPIRDRKRGDCIKALKEYDLAVPTLYPSLGDYLSEPTVGETVHFSSLSKPPPQYTPTPHPGTYPVRVQQFEGAPNADGERTPGERVVWHVPFTSSEIRNILTELPDYRTNPRGFARMFVQNQFSYGMSGTDCARILRAKIGDEMAEAVMSRCSITTHEQMTSGGKEFCKALLGKLPELYGATSTTDVMK